MPETVNTEAGEFHGIFTWNLVRRVFPSLIAQELVSIQPMSRPIGIDFLQRAAEARPDECNELEEEFFRRNPCPA